MGLIDRRQLQLAAHRDADAIRLSGDVHGESWTHHQSSRSPLAYFYNGIHARRLVAWSTMTRRASSAARLGKLGTQEAVPGAIGQQPSGREDHPSRGSHLVARLRPASGDRLLDGVRDGLGAAAEPGQRTLLVDALGGLRDRGVELRVGTVAGHATLDRAHRRVAEAGADQAR